VLWIWDERAPPIELRNAPTISAAAYGSSSSLAEPTRVLAKRGQQRTATASS
jgi:hypothetical protein